MFTGILINDPPAHHLLHIHPFALCIGWGALGVWCHMSAATASVLILSNILYVKTVLTDSSWATIDLFPDIYTDLILKCASRYYSFIELDKV